MIALLSVHGDWEFFNSRSWFRAECEPAVDIWTLSLEQNTLIISIKSYGDNDSHEVIDKINLKMNFDDFVNVFVNEMDRILVCYGLIGYRENWGYEFPLSLYLMIKNSNIVKKELEFGMLKEDEHYGTEAMTSDFDKEIALISNNMKNK